jgi:hypothetical protein
MVVYFRIVETCRSLGKSRVNENAADCRKQRIEFTGLQRAIRRAAGAQQCGGVKPDGPFRFLAAK